MIQSLDQIKEVLGPLRVYENEPLKKHTYFKIGGPAKLFFEAKSVDDLKLALETAHLYKIPFVVLGGGANVLVSDKGFDGFVIKNRAEAIKLGGVKINAHFEVEKGEFIGDRVVTASLFNPKKGDFKNVDQAYFNFAYDSSKIQKTGEIVLEAVFRLNTASDKADLWQRAMDNVKRRNQEQPIGVACSGCIFRNISDSDAKRLATPRLTTSTGYIIESLGLKGTKIGDAQISASHANFIINTAEAKAQDVLQLINLIKEKAKSTYSLDLKEEIFYIGDFDGNL